MKSRLPNPSLSHTIKVGLMLMATATIGHAAIIEYDLEVAEQPWSPGSGIKPSLALTLNGGIPGPTLRFREGDTARIRVHNRLKREETSIHWHGLLLPNAQDGVPHVNTPPIQPGATHTFEFPLSHPGTYWYHSHTGLQEQRGVYGSIVVTPKTGEVHPSSRDHVVVLSDWTRENPNTVMRNLMRGSEWYQLKKGSIQSLSGAAKAGALSDFWERERSRMPAMDVADVAYDAFLVNGRRSIDLIGRPDEQVRLRFINAAASTYFYLQSATGPLKIVAADGPAVKPLEVNRLLVGMAETYDVLVTIPATGRWEIRATAQDGSGHASVWLGQGMEHFAPNVPRPDNYRMDSHLMAAMEDEEDIEFGTDAEAPRPLSPYGKLRSLKSTALPATLPRRTLELRLTGDMERYLWAFNGKTMAEDGVIKIQRGEVLRLELINDTMMHHPIHLHGHFFRVVSEDNERSDAPLKHTVDVPPMGKRIIEFEANESGDWLFHCHLLYHMHSGMARVFSYVEQGEDHQPKLGEHAIDHHYFMIDGSLQNHMSMGMMTLMSSRNDYFASWDVGFEHDSPHGHGEDLAYEVDLGWKRYIDPNLSTVLGWRLTNRDEDEDRAFAGIEYRLPYLVHSSAQLDSEGDLRLGLEKSLRLTDRLSIFGDIQYDTGSEWEWSAGAEWTLTQSFSLISQYHSEHGFGGGIGFRF